MEEAGLIQMPFEEPIFRFKFADAGVMKTFSIFLNANSNVNRFR